MRGVIHRINRLREKKGLTQDEFCNAVGRSRSWLNRITDDTITLGDLENCAIALEVPITHLLIEQATAGNVEEPQALYRRAIINMQDELARLEEGNKLWRKEDPIGYVIIRGMRRVLKYIKHNSDVFFFMAESHDHKKFTGVGYNSSYGKKREKVSGKDYSVKEILKSEIKEVDECTPGELRDFEKYK